MDSSSSSSCESSVQVAVHVRPLLEPESSQGSVSTVVPNEESCTVFLPPSKLFTFDHVFSSSSDAVQGKERDSRERLYEKCVAPMVQGCFEGLNATVFAYGQTGSGKTFTMSSGSNSVIPRVARALFHFKASMHPSGEEQQRHRVSMSVSFFEIYREEIFDLLSGGNAGLSIREDAERRQFVAGLSEVPVETENDLLSQLDKGCRNRATGSTEMNRGSSRSHAVFCVTVKNEDVQSGLCNVAKLHLVDLAGSERAKRTKAEGDRLREGIDINRGLLALGNVISALGDDAKRNANCHVPYRDSKLTRILQDSLGGNSRTLMIACISPADVNFEETVNTLKYAHRARNIQNKPMANQECNGAGNEILVKELRAQIASLQEQLRVAKSCASSKAPAPSPKVSPLETSKLFMRLSERNMELEIKLSRLSDCIKAFRDSGRADDLIGDFEQALEDPETNENIDGEDRKARDTNMADDNVEANSHTAEKDSHNHGDDEEEEERNHFERQVALQNELQCISDELELKVRAVHQMERSDAEFQEMRATYNKAIQDMCEELSLLQLERDDLLSKLEQEKSSGGSGSEREKVLQHKLATLSSKHDTLKKKQLEQQKLARIHARDAKGMDKLKLEITQLKQAKVKLIRKIKEEADQFRKWKQTHEKEVKQLKRQEQKQQYKYMVLERQHAKQQSVLKRKQEEACLAQQKLRDLLQKQRAASKQNTEVLPPFLAQAGLSKAGFEDAFSNWLEEQVQLACSLRVAKKALEGELTRRSELAKKRLAIKQEPKSGDEEEMEADGNDLSPQQIEEQLQECSKRISEMQATVLEAQEANGKLASASKLWTQIRSTHQAKQCLKVLFRDLVSARAAGETLQSRVEQLSEDNDILQKMFLEMEHQFMIEQAERESQFQEKILFALSSKAEVVPADLSEKLESLQNENERLVCMLREGRTSAPPKQVKSKAKPKKDPVEFESEDEFFIDLTDGSEDEFSMDDDDEDWTEDSPAKRKKKGPKDQQPQGKDTKEKDTRKKSTGSYSTGSASRTEEVTEEDVVHAEKQLPTSLVERIDKFKVKELQDALHYIKDSVTGRKETLRTRLLIGLVAQLHQLQKEKGQGAIDPESLLPLHLPDRHEEKKKKADGNDHDIQEDKRAGGEEDKKEVVKNNTSTDTVSKQQPPTRSISTAKEPQVQSKHSDKQHRREQGDVMVKKKIHNNSSSLRSNRLPPPPTSSATGGDKFKTNKVREKENSASMAQRLAAWKAAHAKKGAEGQKTETSSKPRRVLGPVNGSRAGM